MIEARCAVRIKQAIGWSNVARLTLAALTVMAPMLPARAAAPIVICSVDDRSGSAAETGIQGYQGLQMALDEANAAGGIGGHKLQLVAYDGKTDPQLTATFASRCAEDDKGLVIIGGNPSAPAAAMIPVATEEKTPYYILSAGTDSLIDSSATYHFRFGPANRQDAAAIADLLAQQGFKRPAIINNSVPFGIDGARATTAALKKKNISVIAQQTYDINATDLSPQVTNLRDAKPDVVIVFPYAADGARVLRTMQQLNVNVPIVVSRSALLDTLRKLAGPASDGVLIPNTVDPTRPDVQAFFKTFDARFGPHQPTLYPVLGYDAGKAALQVIATPAVLKAIDAGDIAQARTAFRDATEKLNGFKGLQGEQGASYHFGPKQHHGSPDEHWYVFIQVADNGTHLVKPDLSKFKPH
ncbi:ABC transporter substrate-binding protein [Burkholderia sp. Ax-1724]|uniref:ABC transporter substrate-binding protein n=1 Tax=Burkholderia sp. Ax-1724 TaxID=2608336 RepID=UPI001966BA57|nr:ABC transporter substrate-binding protein [Burkholderia sp. Ax-1724]